MSITTKAAGVQAANAAINSYTDQRVALTLEHDETAKSLDRLRQELRNAPLELASLLLPHAELEHLSKLDQLLPGLGLRQARSAKEGERERFSRRLQEIESDIDFQNRETLRSDFNGELGHGLYALRASCAEAQERRDSLDGCKTFTFALNRQLDQSQGLSAFQSFWRVVTLSSVRENSARKSSCEKFGSPDWQSLVAEYDGLYERLAVDLPRLAQLEERRQRLDALEQEREEASRWTFHFEEQLTSHLKELFSDRVTTLKLDTLCSKTRGRAAMMVARLDALRAQVEYLQALANYLEGEATDRQARVAKLTYVRGRWARSYGPLRSDKTKWLVTVPAIKAESCDKCCRWSRRLRQNLEGYQDFESYAVYLSGIPGMLPYDAFAYGSSEAMPYEGFVRQVIPALERHRVVTGQLKADYAPFKAKDKERGSQGRDPREESGQYDNPQGDLEGSFETEVESERDSFDDDAALGAAAYYATASSMDYGDLS